MTFDNRDVVLEDLHVLLSVGDNPACNIAYLRPRNMPCWSRSTTSPSLRSAPQSSTFEMGAWRMLRRVQGLSTVGHIVTRETDRNELLSGVDVVSQWARSRVAIRGDRISKKLHAKKLRTLSSKPTSSALVTKLALWTKHSTSLEVLKLRMEHGALRAISSSKCLRKMVEYKKTPASTRPQPGLAESSTFRVLIERYLFISDQHRSSKHLLRGEIVHSG